MKNHEKSLNLTVEQAREIHKNASPDVKSLLETTFTQDELVVEVFTGSKNKEYKEN